MLFFSLYYLPMQSIDKYLMKSILYIFYWLYIIGMIWMILFFVKRMEFPCSVHLFGVLDKASQKKLNLFLCWMIHRDLKVDFGV